MKDLNTMFSEEDKRKPHRGKKGEKADDKRYIALMVEYKKLRRNPEDRDKAREILEQAIDLGIDGEVSDNAKVAASYL